jgi:hypothetical protein
MDMRELFLLPNNKTAAMAFNSNPNGWRDARCEARQVFLFFPPSKFDTTRFEALNEEQIYYFLYKHEFKLSNNLQVIPINLN